MRMMTSIQISHPILVSLNVNNKIYKFSENYLSDIPNTFWHNYYTLVALIYFFQYNQYISYFFEIHTLYKDLVFDRNKYLDNDIQ